MFVKTITYHDYNGIERTEEFRFNLTKAELVEMEHSINGGFTQAINQIVSAKDDAQIMKVFKDLILKSYGEKTIDGKRFRKIDNDGTPLSIAFSETEAYSVLFMELVTDEKAAAAFIQRIIPEDLAADMPNMSELPAAIG